MRSLNDRGARWVVVTQGARPVWVSSESETYRLDPFTVDQQEVVNPIGCGDCMAAAVAWAIRDGRGIVDAVRFGIAAAAENLRELLPGRLNLAKVEARAKDLHAEKL